MEDLRGSDAHLGGEPRLSGDGRAERSRGVFGMVGPADDSAETPSNEEFGNLALAILRELAEHDSEIAKQLAELGLDRDDN